MELACFPIQIKALDLFLIEIHEVLSFSIIVVDSDRIQLAFSCVEFHILVYDILNGTGTNSSVPCLFFLVCVLQ